MAESGTPQEKQGQVVAVVREWDPHHHESLKVIHDTIDSWGRSNGAATSTPAGPAPDHGEVVSKVDRLTRNVKARTVTVTETIVLPADEAGHREPWDGERAGTTRSAGRRPKAKAGKAGKRASKATPAKVRADPAYKPQCAALTADGSQCRNSARGTSKYCAPHKGYQPPTAKGLAQRIEGEAWDPKDNVTDRSSVAGADTRPVVRKAKDTKVSVRKVAKKGRGKKR